MNIGLNGGKQHFTISLLIHPLTVQSCLQSVGPSQERTGRSVMSDSRMPLPFFSFSFFLSVIHSLSFCLFLSSYLFVECALLNANESQQNGGVVCLWDLNGFTTQLVGTVKALSFSSITGGAFVCGGGGGLCWWL